MKQIARIRPLRGLAMLAVGALGSVGVRAQVAPAGQAQVYAVVEDAFSVPQVRLPDAAVAHRINRLLRRLLVTANVSPAAVDSMASLKQQLRQAHRRCCYNAEEKSWLVGQGFTGRDYQLLLNRHNLLSLSATTEFIGAHQNYHTRYLTFDLQTGRLLTLADVVAEPLPRLGRRMQGAINRRYSETALSLKATYSAARDTARLRQWLALLSWDATAQRVKLPWDANELPTTVFALTSHALLLFYRGPDFGYWDQGLAPDDTYHFPYRTLQVGRRLAWAQPAQPKAAARPPGSPAKGPNKH